jgi:dipeptidyl aminopeptidase/acylaminoacyl peptidase
MLKLLGAIALVVTACTPRPSKTVAAPPANPMADFTPRSPDPEPRPAEPLPQAQGTPRTDLIPRAVLFGNPDRTNVQLSPDGTQLSWLAPKDGVMNVWVAPVGKLDTAKPVTSETKRPIRSYRWAYTNKHVVYAQDVGGNEDFHVFGVSLADGKVTDLTPVDGVRANLGLVSHKKPGSIAVFMNERDRKVMEPHEIDLATGKRTLLITQPVEEMAGFVLDDLYQVKLATKRMPDGSLSVVRPPTKTEKGTWFPVDTIPFEDSRGTDIVRVETDGKRAIAIDSRGRDTAAVVRLDVGANGKVTSRVLAEDPKSDAGFVLLHPKTGAAQAVSFNYERTTWKLIDKTLAPDFAALAKIDPTADVAIHSRTLDDKTWLVSTSSSTKSRVFHLYTRATKKSAVLFASQPALDTQPLVAMEPVTIKARDGLALVSYLSKPAGATGPVPMVLLVHGGPWGRDGWGYNPYHQLLANRGYAVLSVNFRASSGFGKKHLNAGNLQWGKSMHDDLLDAVAWAVTQNVTTKDKVCIMGGSYGGYATLVGLAMTPDVFACGVDIVGPSNLLTLLATIPTYWAPQRDEFYARIGNPTTDEGKALLVAASPLTHASKITKPLLIAQGANDPRVKQAESEQIVGAMTAAKLPVTYALFPDEGHGFARPENSIVFVGITEAFLSAHLGGTYAPLSSDEIMSSSMQIKSGKNGVPGL